MLQCVRQLRRTFRRKTLATPPRTAKQQADERAYTEADNALRAALNIAKNVLGKDADELALAHAAHAVLTVAFAPNSTEEMRAAFLRPG